MTTTSEAARTLLTSTGRGWRGLHADFVHVSAGKLDVPGNQMHGVGVHFGPAVNANCRLGTQRMRRVQKAGDIDIVPAGFEGSWDDDADCWILSLQLDRSLIDQVAKDLGWGCRDLELLPRLQLRDPRIEAIAWAVKAELETLTPSDSLFIDHLANAMAVRLIETSSSVAVQLDTASTPRLSARQLRLLTEFIEGNLDQKLHLADLARIAGLSVTRLKSLFRNTTGVPVHQYVIRRRVEYARGLLTTTALPASEVALKAGFSHQSHMASTMRRLLGQTPSDIVRHGADYGSNLQ